MEPLPEINLNLKTAKDTAKKTANRATSSLKAAGSLVAKKAEHTKLIKVTLPRAYAELGKAVFKQGSRREEFRDSFNAVDNLLAERKRIHEQGKARPAGTTMAEKAQKVASDATDMARIKAIDIQALQAFSKLGEAVYQQHGSDAGPASAVEPIARAMARRDQLDGEMRTINMSAKGKWITPKRLAWGMGIFIGLAVLGRFSEDKPHIDEGTQQGGTSLKDESDSVSAVNDSVSVVIDTRVSDSEDREGWKGYAASLQKDIKRSEKELAEAAKVAKEAEAALAAGRPSEMDETMWELRRERLLLIPGNYASAKQRHEELLQRYSQYRKEVEQEKQAAATAAAEAEERRKKQAKEDEAAKKRIAAKKKSRNAPKMNPPKETRGLAEYKEGWEQGVTLGYQWLDRVEQAAKGKRLEQYLKENPLAKARAEEELNGLRNEVLFRVNEMTRAVQSLRERGITIGLDHPDAGAAHSRWTFALGKQEGYAAVVFPVIYPMKDGK